MKTHKVSRRLGNRKETTGCVTCKIRRIKCGEERPSCLRCTSTGRRCDGYKESYSAKDSVTLRQADARADCKLVSVDITAEESRILNFFVSQGAAEIAGWINADFWTRVVPQLSQSQRALQHAMIAIGAFMLLSQDASHQCAMSVAGFMGKSDLQAFAIEHYGRAMSSTRKTIMEQKGGGAGTNLATVTCILFVCIEALQGHYRQAISLFHQGQKVFDGSKSLESPRSSTVVAWSAPLHSDIRTTFTRLATQFKMFHITPSERESMEQIAFAATVPSHSSSIISLDQARNELLDLFAIVQSIAKVGNDCKWSQPQSKYEHKFVLLARRREEVDITLQGWNSRFQEFRVQWRGKAKVSPKERFGISILSQQYHMLRIWLAGSHETSECCYDNYLPQFVSILEHAGLIVRFIKETGSSTAFCVEIGFIPSLYWTAIKCRCPILRRRALSLLNESPRQEGLWDSLITSNVARRVIQLEEDIDDKNFNLNATMSEENKFRFPPEEKRIKIVRINLKTVVGEQEGVVTEMFTLPHGREGEWSIRREFLPL